MNSRLAHLQHKRTLLISLAAAQRSALPFTAHDLQHHLRYIDLGFSLLQVARKHPALSIMSATLLLPAPRNKLILWSGRLFTSWEIFTLMRKQWRKTR